MEIISLNFAVFVLLTVIIYQLLPITLRNNWLLIISIFFYLSRDIRFFLVLAILIIVNYSFAFHIINNRTPKVFIVGSFVLNLSVFGLIKILNSNYPGVIFKNGSLFQNEWILPVGFSYYMLQLLSFQFDIHSGRISQMPSFKDFFLYLIYFPKLLAGPIEKPKAFFTRLAAPKVVDKALYSRAFGLIIIGLIRTIFIAYLLSNLMPNWIRNADQVGWAQVIGFVIYIYNDFAGYTSIIRGVSCFYGIELSQNFSQPLLSRNFSEFWNRWHITLSVWLRENIYFPLSRKLNRNSGNAASLFVAFIFPPLLTMVASGFWHGASLALILWGSLLGGFMILERFMFEHWPKLRLYTQIGIGSLLSNICTFILFCVAMVPLAVKATKPTLIIWGNLFSRPDFSTNNIIIPILLLGGLSFFIDYMNQKTGNELWWVDLKLIPRSAIVAFGILLLLVSITLISFQPPEVFIYQGF